MPSVHGRCARSPNHHPVDRSDTPITNLNAPAEDARYGWCAAQAGCLSAAGAGSDDGKGDDESSTINRHTATRPEGRNGDARLRDVPSLCNSDAASPPERLLSLETSAWASGVLEIHACV